MAVASVRRVSTSLPAHRRRGLFPTAGGHLALPIHRPLMFPVLLPVLLAMLRVLHGSWPSPGVTITVSVGSVRR
jgi:hypothetical protein